MFSRYRPSSLTLVLLAAWSSQAVVNTSTLRASPAEEADKAVVVEIAEVNAMTRAPLIDFARDVHPILTVKCLRCHGPEEAKNDFRVDDAATLLTYVEPRNVEGSSLWSDYLVTEDADMRMPPASIELDGQLTAVELATIKLWIEEGGMWNLEPEVSGRTEDAVATSLPGRIWQFQGLFHPATTHFPIALLTISAGFVFLSYFRPDTCEPVAFHCLWIGALGAVVASAAGWSYATYEGYGAFSFDLFHSAIDRHRWMGVAVALLSVILIPVAMYVRRTEDFGMRSIWFIGSLLLLAGVGLAGYQGGELTYGEGHYEKEFVKLFPEAFVKPDEQAVSTDVEEEVAVPATANDESAVEKELEDSQSEGSEAKVEPAADSNAEQRDVSSDDVSPPTDASASEGSSVDSDADQPPAVVQPQEHSNGANNSNPPAEPKPAVVF